MMKMDFHIVFDLQNQQFCSMIDDRIYKEEFACCIPEK